MNRGDTIDYFLKRPDGFLHITSKERKQLLLNYFCMIIEGNLYDPIYENLGSGVWKLTMKKRIYKQQTQTP